MNKESLLQNLALRGIACSDEQANQLVFLMKKTLETNECFNLTAITDEGEFMEKMIFDSALALHDLDLTGKSIIDIGTGAGFPGLVLYLLNPEAEVTLLDATKKKTDYLRALADENSWRIKTINDRSESLSRKTPEKYDYAVARAVSSLPVLLETILPLVRVGGYFIAMKGRGAEEEMKQSEKAMKKLNCHVESIYQDILPECGEARYLLLIRKDAHTPAKYPREYSDIRKKPL